MEPDILQELYERYQRELYLYLCSLSGSEAIAEDLLQETFLKALLSLPDGHENVRAWLYMVARNLYFDQWKHDKRAQSPLPEQWASETDGPLEELLRDEAQRLLYQGLSTLEPRKREVLQLQYFGGFSQREISRLLHLKPEHVRVLAHRAKAELRKWMEVHGYDIP